MLLVSTVAPSGCALFSKFEESKVAVPEKNTPREQTQVAEQQYRTAQQTVDVDQRKSEFRKAIVAFRRVGERFPDDTTYAPAASLMVADLYVEIEDFKRAEKAYRQTIAGYESVPDVHASALAGLGETLIKLDRAIEGQARLQELMDLYGTSENPVIRQRVRQAQRELNRVR
jgi:tetratricopeptide (TPR) repeat protein